MTSGGKKRRRRQKKTTSRNEILPFFGEELRERGQDGAMPQVAMTSKQRGGRHFRGGGEDGGGVHVRDVRPNGDWRSEAPTIFSTTSFLYAPLPIFFHHALFWQKNELKKRCFRLPRVLLPQHRHVRVDIALCLCSRNNSVVVSSKYSRLSIKSPRLSTGVCRYLLTLHAGNVTLDLDFSLKTA